MKKSKTSKRNSNATPSTEVAKFNVVEQIFKIGIAEAIRFIIHQLL